MTLLSCRGVTLAYDARVAVDRVSFTVEEGDYILVAGENGSGKSTLIKGILGLLPLKAGEILFEGVKRNDIGYLPQQTRVQRDFPASVWEVVLSGCMNSAGMRPFFSKEDKARAKSVMHRLKIWDMRALSYRSLSGGQQQRALLARALLATGRLLLLDEPVTGLDPIASHEMYSSIKRLNRENGIAVIMVSHDIGCAIQDAKHVLHLGTGRMFFGTAREYRDSDIGGRFIGCAYMKAPEV